MGATEQKEPSPRRALGRGLAALIPEASAVVGGVGLRKLPIEKIQPNRAQPRKHFDDEALEELAASIRVQGVLQPIVVRRAGAGYEIVAGERRWRAAARAGLQEIPALIKECTDVAALQVALIENLQRADLDPLEEAQAYHRLCGEHGLTHDEVATAVGKSRSAVTNSLRLLKLPPEALAMLADGRLTAGHARALMTLPTQADMLRLAEDFSKRGVSVREAERQARQLAKAEHQPHRAEAASPSVQAIEERLQRRFGTKVRVHHRAGSGRIELFFHSLDELDALLEQLS